MAKSVDTIKRKSKKPAKKAKKIKRAQKKKSSILSRIEKKANKQVKIKLTKKHFLIAGIVLTIFALYVIFCIASDITLRGRIYPNVWVGDLNLGNQTSDSAEEIINQRFKNYLDNTNLTLVSDNQQFQLNPKDMEASVDLNKTSENLMNIGHGENFLKAGLTRLGLVFKKKNITASINLNQEKWDNFTESIAGKVESPYQDATLKIENGKVVDVPSATGIQIEKPILKDRVDMTIGTFLDNNIEIPKIISNPKIILEDTIDARKTTELMISAPIQIVYKEKQYDVSTDVIGSWVDFIGKPVDNVLGVQTEGGSEKDNKNQKYILIAQLNQDEVKNYIQKNISKNIDVAAKNAILSFSNGALKIATASVVGRSVDQDQLFNDIQTVTKSETYRKATVKINTTIPEIREDNLASLGIVELISEGVSSFAGSPSNRIVNIKVGASKFNSVLIKPGEEFSFNTALGPVDASTGFLPELVIKEHVTVPEYGGGLCQVSTTAFRAALLAGLPILERKEHAYYVQYYSWPYGPGVDATIYPPHPDVRFKNDTGNYILIQTKISGSKLYFDFYGTKAGRSATINTPQVLYSNPDGSMGVLFTRDVFLNGQKTRTDTFKSNYKSPSLFPHE